MEPLCNLVGELSSTNIVLSQLTSAVTGLVPWQTGCSATGKTLCQVQIVGNNQKVIHAYSEQIMD